MFLSSIFWGCNYCLLFPVPRFQCGNTCIRSCCSWWFWWRSWWRWLQLGLGVSQLAAKTLHAVPQRFRPDQMPRVLLEFEPSSCQQIPKRLSCLNVNDYLRKANPGFFHTLHSESEAPWYQTSHRWRCRASYQTSLKNSWYLAANTSSWRESRLWRWMLKIEIMGNSTLVPCLKYS